MDSRGHGYAESKNSIKWICAAIQHTSYGGRLYALSFTTQPPLSGDTSLPRPCHVQKKLSMWKSGIKSAWPAVDIKDVQIQIGRNGDGDAHTDSKQSTLKVGSELKVKALVRLGKSRSG